MSLIKLPKQKTVSYMGEEIQIPENHNWVMLGFQETYTGQVLSIISSENKPTSHAHGFKVDLNSDFKFISEVEDSAINPKDSLVYVGDSTRDCLYDALEVLIGTLVNIKNSDMPVEQKLHEVFCMEHGVLTQFLQYNAQELSNRYDARSLDADDHDELETSFDKSEILKQISKTLGVPVENIHLVTGSPDLEQEFSDVFQPTKLKQ